MGASIIMTFSSQLLSWISSMIVPSFPLRFQGIANEGTIIDDIQLSSWDEKVMMIEAPIYRGNSGSPIINKNGQVIGIVFATLNQEEHGKVGLFIPIDYYFTYHN